jgi:dihydropteroate synthase
MLFSELNLATPHIMGILNVTPDSFSDGGRYNNLDAALRHVENMQADGARLIDVGGESTRPGAIPISTQEELDRVIPVIEALQARFNLVISIDTSKTAVMRAAVQAGASLINDVNALQADQALETAIQLAVPVCLMHKQGTPNTMQHNPQYANVVDDVWTFLQARAALLQPAQLPKSHIVLDPGFGFGKTVTHNLTLLRQLKKFTQTEHPVLVGLSRKSMLGAITGRETANRVAASVAASLIALQQGAKILRVHDVAPTRDAIKVWLAVR